MNKATLHALAESMERIFDDPTAFVDDLWIEATRAASSLERELADEVAKLDQRGLVFTASALPS